MAGTDERRRELGAFLRVRREHLVRADYGLPPVGRSRTTGLRREEIAYLSGVSVTWYTWLEQGRDINPSRQVLEAIALEMRLSAAERAYVLELAGFAPLPHSATPDPAPVPDHLLRLVENLVPSPAFVVSADWSIGDGTVPTNSCTRASPRSCRRTEIYCGSSLPTRMCGRCCPTGRSRAGGF